MAVSVTTPGLIAASELLPVRTVETVPLVTPIVRAEPVGIGELFDPEIAANAKFVNVPVLDAAAVGAESAVLDTPRSLPELTFRRQSL